MENNNELEQTQTLTRPKKELTEKKKEAIKKMRIGREKWLAQKKADRELEKQNKKKKPKVVPTDNPSLNGFAELQEPDEVVEIEGGITMTYEDVEEEEDDEFVEGDDVGYGVAPEPLKKRLIKKSAPKKKKQVVIHNYYEEELETESSSEEEEIINNHYNRTTRNPNPQYHLADVKKTIRFV